MNKLALSLLVSAACVFGACASGASAQPQVRETRVAWNERPSHVQRCQIIAAEYRALRREGRLRGEARRDVLQRFHRTGCMGSPLFEVNAGMANTGSATIGSRSGR